ncbi:uncharacterized protein LOC126900064 [Daktulosphaira vitifoliae]|uniref:uncharacterized protein LOC126900064 n=1 Tax=Daktulosphaira vitifoliae TaxID=58002 RepID=UPI0021A9FE19|nr:uncharacterized protein LOC126900064 [Daktulosphaira vitifoliae]
MSFFLIPSSYGILYFLFISCAFKSVILDIENDNILNNEHVTDNSNNTSSIFVLKVNEHSSLKKSHNYKQSWKNVLSTLNTCNKDVYLPDLLTTNEIDKKFLLNISDKWNQDKINETITSDNCSKHIDNTIINTDVLDDPGRGHITENLTASVRNVTVNEDIPSFREWTKKQLEEAEKQPTLNETKFKHENKILKKNFASPECGAKVVSTNPEAKYPHLLLTLPNDEYMLNLCKSTTWFVVELCEAIQVKRIELANYELFSSTPKEFSVFVASRLNTRNWTPIAHLVAEDVRVLQDFHINTTIDNVFTKYVKVEIHSHYGKEHYCPISVFNAYGLSEFEALERADDPGLENPQVENEDVDDFEVIDEIDVDKNKTNSKSTLLDSARTAVMSIVKIAADVLDIRQKSPCDTPPCSINETTYNFTDVNQYINCITPGYIMVCHGCNDTFYKNMFDIISCESNHLTEIYQNKYIYESIINSDICADYGLDFSLLKKRNKHKKLLNGNQREKFITSLFPLVKIAALCNTLAIIHNKIALNKAKRIYINDDLIINLQTASSDVISQNSSNSSSSYQKSDESTQSSSPISSNSVTLDLSSFIEPIVAQILPTKISATKDEPPMSLTHQLKETINVNIENITAETSSSQEYNMTSGVPTQSSTEYVTSTIVNNTIVTDIDNSNIRNSTTEIKPPQEQQTDNFDNFFKDFETEESENDKCNSTASESSIQYTTVQPSVLSQNTKQSLFIRLANRIKDLERNMSLSGEYLQELSTRYKKQVDDMQRTILELTEENRLIREQDLKILEEIKFLSDQVSSLQSTLHYLKAETENFNLLSFILSDSSPTTVMIFCFLILAYVALRLLGFIGKHGKELVWESSIKPNNTRRLSTNDIPSDIKEKHRRPSEEALFSSGTTHQDLLIRNNNGENVKSERRRRRKRKELILKSKSNAINLEVGGMENGGNIKMKSSHKDIHRSASSSDLTSIDVPNNEFMKTALSIRTNRMSGTLHPSNGFIESNKNLTESKSKSIKNFLKRIF